MEKQTICSSDVLVLVSGRKKVLETRQPGLLAFARLGVAGLPVGDNHAMALYDPRLLDQARGQQRSKGAMGSAQ